MKIDTFWVVCRADSKSELSDVLFEASAQSLIKMARGGLKEADIVSIYTDWDEALSEANRQLELAESKPL